MIEQSHKSLSNSPKVLWPVLVIILLGLLIGGFFWLNYYIYDEKQGDEENIAVVLNQDNDNATNAAEVADLPPLNQWQNLNKVRVNDTTQPQTSPELSFSLTDLSEFYPNVRSHGYGAVAFRDDVALIGGTDQALLRFDGNQLKDITDVLPIDDYSTVETVAANDQYWLINVYGSMFSRLYKYDGSNVELIHHPEEPRAITAMEWTGTEWLLGFRGGRLMRFDGTDVKEVSHPLYMFEVASISWDGSRALVLFTANQDVHRTYMYSNGTLTPVNDPPASGSGWNVLNTVRWNGKYWLATGEGGLLLTFDGSNWGTLQGAELIHGVPVEIEWVMPYWIVRTSEGVFAYNDEKREASDLTSVIPFGLQIGAIMAFGESYGLFVGGTWSDDSGTVVKFTAPVLSDGISD